MNNFMFFRQSVKFRSYSHLGEIVQGPVRHNGQPETVVVTLPCSVYYSDAEFVRDENCDGIIVDNPKLKTSREFLRRFGERYGLGGQRGRVNIRSNIPVGAGAGSSTCDLNALAQCLECVANVKLTKEERQRMIFETEGASDPLALIGGNSTPVYFSRRGELHSTIPKKLPSMVCLAFLTDDKAVKTNDLIGREGYTTTETNVFAAILTDVKRAVLDENLSLLASAAERSATMNQSRVPTRNYHYLRAITRRFGAGFTVSHSGVTGSVFFPKNTGKSVVVNVAKALATECGYTNFQLF